MTGESVGKCHFCESCKTYHSQGVRCGGREITFCGTLGPLPTLLKAKEIIKTGLVIPSTAIDIQTQCKDYGEW